MRNQFTAFVGKEFLHILRDPWTMIILLLLPVVMLILFGFALSTEVKDIRFSIYDPGRQDKVNRLVERIDSNSYFRLTAYLKSPEDIKKIFLENKADLVLLFPSKIKDSAHLQLLVDGSDPNTAVAMISYAATIIRRSFQEGGRIQIHSRLIFNPEMKSAYHFVPGLMGMVIMLICAMMTSVSIAREKESGTMELVLVSPLSPILIIIAKAVPYFVLSCCNLMSIILFSVFLLQVPIAGEVLALIFLSLLFIFVSLAIGILISSVAKSQVMALLLSGMALMMPAVYLSGMMFPIENMPLPLQAAAQMVPAKWYILAVRKIMIKGLGFHEIIRELLILSAMATTVVALSIKRFALRLE